MIAPCRDVGTGASLTAHSAPKGAFGISGSALAGYSSTVGVSDPFDRYTVADDIKITCVGYGGCTVRTAIGGDIRRLSANATIGFESMQLRHIV